MKMVYFISSLWCIKHEI